MIYTRSNEYENTLNVEYGDYAMFTNHDTGTIVQGTVQGVSKNPYMDGVHFIRVEGVQIHLRSEDWEAKLIERPRPELVFEPGLYVQSHMVNRLDVAVVYRYGGDGWIDIGMPDNNSSIDRINKGEITVTKLGQVT